MRRPLLASLLLATIALPVAAQQAAPRPAEPGLPAVPREFRAVWVATVSNIDWPSRPGLSTEEQQRELVAILDRAAALNLNAVIFQVRPGGDAIYASKLEPWSYFLTGAQGRAPEPFWDPLEFVVREAHRRGLELHAWFNPYRASVPADTSRRSPLHLQSRRPSLVKRYGTFDWMDPAEPEVQQLALRVVRDVVKRYDIDGVHIDDYFYPYKVRDPVRGGELDFPDDASWRRYRRSGGKLARDDWRRRHVNQFVQRLHAAVKAEKPRVKFGISPFGIWRPGYPAGVTGLDAYSALYADARLWLRNGWVDYWTPQLYWHPDARGQRYDALLDWWADENLKDRHLWPGLFTSRAAGLDARNLWMPNALVRQIDITRADPRASGHVHFSMRALMSNVNALADTLLMTYAEPALVPASPWLDRSVPARPEARLRQDSSGTWIVRATPGGKERPWRWIVRIETGGAWRTLLLPGYVDAPALEVAIPDGVPTRVAVSAVDRTGNEGPARIVRAPLVAGHLEPSSGTASP